MIVSRFPRERSTFMKRDQEAIRRDELEQPHNEYGIYCLEITENNLVATVNIKH